MRLRGLVSLVLFGAILLPSLPRTVRAQGSDCIGDCGRDGEVTIDDLLVMVSIALGTAPLSSCEAGNANGDDEITIDEILAAVANALNACPSTPTPTTAQSESTSTPTETEVETPTPTAPQAQPTSTPTATPSPTATERVPVDQAPAVAARAAVAVKALSVAPLAVSAVVNGIQFGAPLITDPMLGSAAGTCPRGGTATRTGSLTSFNLSATLSQCAVDTRDGTVTFDGNAAVGGSLLNITLNADVSATFRDAGGSETSSARMVLMGRVTQIPIPSGQCQLSSLTLLITSGNLSATVPRAGTSQVNFQNTTVTLSNIVYDANCIPQMYRLTFNGNAALLTPGGQPENVTFNMLRMDVDESGSGTFLDASGGMTSSCLGGSVQLSTPERMRVPADALCPNAGHIRVMAGQGVGNVFYRSDMSVEVDLDGDGQAEITAPNCLDPRLLMCAA
jgi:hypothetical protein